MANIVAGIFDTSIKAEGALYALRGEGVPGDSISMYHNNAPGQHGTYPIGAEGLGEDPEDESTLPPPVARRPAGIMVAVNLDGTMSQDAVVALMRKHAPILIEEARGEWREGQWTDFNPVAAPQLVWQDQEAFNSSRH